MDHKFYPGQKVRCIKNDDFGGTKVGEMFELYSDDTTYLPLYIKTDKWPNGRYLNFNLGDGVDGVLYEIVKQKDESKAADLIYNNPLVGKKNDQGKPRVSLIPKAAILGAARGLTYGEKKYGTHNFRNGLSFSRLADATMRHLTSWLEGENNDPESGLSHLDHAIASLAMLKFMEEHRQDMDDRWLDPMYTDPKPNLSESDIMSVSEELQKRGR